MAVDMTMVLTGLTLVSVFVLVPGVCVVGYNEGKRAGEREEHMRWQRWLGERPDFEP